jgi:hypothetical protein
MRSLPGHALLISLATFTALALSAPDARARTVIKRPGYHIDYAVELEPHLNFGFFHYRNDVYRDRNRYYWTPDIGPGFRATIPIMDPGFIRRINDSVGITFGADMTWCSPDYCDRNVFFRFPVGIQWNFFITERFSAFGDAGFMLRVDAGNDRYRSSAFYPDFFIMGGARILFSDSVGLTVRVGYPYVSVGVSFFL